MIHIHRYNWEPMGYKDPPFLRFNNITKQRIDWYIGICCHCKKIKYKAEMWQGQLPELSFDRDYKGMK